MSTNFSLLALLFLLASCQQDEKSSLRTQLEDRVRSFIVKTKNDSVNSWKAGCLEDEEKYLHIESEFIEKWESAWKRKDKNFLAGVLSQDIAIHKLAIWGANTRRFDSLSLAAWVYGSDKIKGRDHVSRHIENYLNSIKEVVDFELNVVEFRNLSSDKSEFKNIELKSRFDLRGLNRNGMRRQDRGIFNISLTRQDGKWLMSKLEIVEGETLVAERAPLFKEVTLNSGIDKAQVYLRDEAIRRGGYALSLSDINNDGHVDMYIGARGAATLWSGKSNFTWSEDKSSGLGGDTFVKSAAFVDLNNNGFKDLILTRFEQDPNREDVLFYKNEGEKFSKLDKALAKHAKTNYAMPMAVADFNNDSFLDLYVGYPGEKDFTVTNDEAAEESRDQLAVQGLYLNNKNHKFVDKSFTMESSSKRERGKIYPHASLSFDYDSDGQMDIMVIDDRMNLSPIYKNNGKGELVEVTEKIMEGNDGYGMGVTAVDLFNNGHMDMVVTNVSFVASERLINSCRINRKGNFDLFDTNKGLRLYRGTKERFVEERGIGLDWIGEGAAGVEYLDYNNDGFQDLYVSMGLWSGTPGGEELSSLFIRNALIAREQPPEAFLIQDAASADLSTSDRTSFLELLKSDKKEDERPSMAGHERNRLFRNNGDGTFTEVGFLEGVDSPHDGYMVARTDINKDGKVDLVLRNADPGTKAISFPTVQVFRNDNSNNSIQIHLIGSSSNRDAIGAKLHLLHEGRVQYQQLMANNGAVQSELVTIFGIGKSKKADRLSIRWPSGKTQVLKNIKAGTHTIYEKGDILSAGK